MTRTRVLIADDNRMIREGLVELLEMQPELELVGVAENGVLAVQLAQKLRPDILLLDISMPVMNGLEALPLIKNKSPQTDVIVLSMYGLDSIIIQALYSGATGYVLKTADSSQVLEAIRAVRRGCHYLSPKLIKGDVEKAFLSVQPNHCV